VSDVRTSDVSESQNAESSASRCLRRLAREQGEGLFVDDTRSSLSYAEFEQLADRAAAGLLELMGPGDRPIAILCSEVRSLSVAALGANRAGKTVAVLDAGAPEDRIRHILEDLGAPFVLSDGDGQQVGGRPSVHPLTFPQITTPLPPVVQPGVASIQYTSGSTGDPKGVMTPAAARDALGEGLSLMGQATGLRVPYLLGNTWRDAMVHAALIAGVTLVPYDVARDGVAPLPKWLADKDIGALAAVPTLLRAIVSRCDETRQLRRIRLVVSNGEALLWSDVASIRRHMAPDVPIYNLFGLTESGTIAVNAIAPDAPIGRGPIPPGFILPGVEVEIVDKDGSTLPVGAEGEIVATSPTVMLGYWRRPDLTDRILTPLADGRRRLRTGDGGRLRTDGTLEHLGRLDHVVKISGRRLELGEIEANLSRLPGVAAAAAATYEDVRGQLRLAAFVVPTAASSPSPVVLRSELGHVMPAWALPDRIMVVEELPHLPNGKVDRRALPDRASAGEGPKGDDDLTAGLVRLWQVTLDRSDVGPDDDFFLAGGDSMRAASLFAAIADELGHDGSPTLLIDHSTPRQLADALGAEATSSELLAFNVGGSEPPLIAVHDGAGNIGHVRQLAIELGPDQPIYAIRGIGLDGKRVPFDTVEALADHYLELIEPAVPPDAPLRLIGFSLGGLIAFQMGLRLQEQGRSVECLIAGDTMWPHAQPEAPAKSRGAHLREALHRRDLLGAATIVLEHHRWRRRRIAESRSWRRSVTYMESDELVPLEDRWNFGLYQYGSMAQCYAPSTTFSSDFLLLRTPEWPDAPDRGWNLHVGAGIEISDLRCEHGDLGRELGMPEVATSIRDYLTRIPRTEIHR
jgi:acyl-coenzyme A synthetase/AMP-(fatty) acid ligase/thioesterase domain-containing protein